MTVLDKDIGQFFLFLLQLHDFFFNAVLHDQIVDRNRFFLSDPIGPIRGLILGAEIPPGVVVDDGFGSGQI